MTTTDHDDIWGDIGPGSRKLLQAALAAFAARGYHGASTRHIAAAGTSPAAVYAHHRTKSDLLYAISLAAGHQHTLLTAERALTSETTPSGRVRSLANDFTAWHARHHQHARVVQYELNSLLPEHRAHIVELRRRTERLFRHEVQAGEDAGVFHTGDVTGASLAILSLGIDVSRWYRPGGSRTPAGIGRLYAGMALTMLGVSPTAIVPRP